MLSIYWFCFLIGGIFVALAVLGGLDGVDFEFEPDSDLDWVDPKERNPETKPRSRRRSARRFSPFEVVKSLKFWTFGSCFFGLTGLVLSHLGTGMNPLMVLIIAISIGLLVGTALSTTLLFLRHSNADSLVRTEDLVGMLGVVEIPVTADSKGKVQLRVKGSTRTYVAMTDSDQPLTVGQVVLVVETQGSCLWVVAQESQRSSSMV